MSNKILIPLQSLVSCFLETPANRQAAVGTTEGLWRGYSSVCPKGSTHCWAPVAGLVGSPCSPRDSQESSPTPQFKSINFSALSFLHSPTLTSTHDHWKNHSLG